MKISIFTPCHNSTWLRDAYASIKDQDFFEWVILYNNGSERITFDDPRIKIVDVGEQKPWVGYLKNLACKNCRGDVLLELDCDDLLMPTAIEEIVAAFEDSAVGFVYSNAIHATAELEKVDRFSPVYGWTYREVTVEGHDLEECVSFDPTPAAVGRIWFAPDHLRAFRRSVYESVGGYSTEMRVLDDQDLMCRLYKVTRFHHIDKPLYLYRVHGGNTWLDPEINSEIQTQTLRLHDENFENLCAAWADDKGLRKLDLGGRIAGKAGFESVDLRDSDIVADLNGPWPFKDGEVGVVRAFDVFEHLRDPIHTMSELFRVLAPGGYAIIQVPSTDGRGAFQDPTHVSFWNENSFHYYTRAAKNRYIECPVRFQAIRLYTTPKNDEGVCWTIAHLCKLYDNIILPGEKLI